MANQALGTSTIDNGYSSETITYPATTINGYITDTTADPATTVNAFSTETTTDPATTVNGFSTETTTDPATKVNGFSTETTTDPATTVNGFSTETTTDPATTVNGFSTETTTYQTTTVNGYSTDTTADPATTVNGRTTPQPPASRIGNISVVTRDTSHLILTWEVPNYTPDDCEVTVNDIAAQVYADCAAFSMTITNLAIAGGEYEITIMVILGSERPSETVNERTLPPQPTLSYIQEATTVSSISIQVNLPPAEQCEVDQVDIILDGSAENLTVSCINAPLNITIEGLNAGTEYDFVGVAKIDDIEGHNSSTLTGPTKPAPVTNLVVNLYFDGLIVTWNQPTDSNTALYKQAVSWYRGSTFVNSENLAADATSHIISGPLRPGSYYRVKVETVTRHEESSEEYNAEHETFILTSLQPADIVLISDATERTMKVTWEDPNGNTTGFVLRCACQTGQRACADRVDIEVPSNQTEAECEGLTPGSWYDVTVLVLVDTENATSGAVSESTATASPSNVTVTDISSEYLRVEWTDPNGNTTRFKVNCTCQEKNCLNFIKDDVDGNSSEYTCSGLTPGSGYLVNVTAMFRTDKATSTETVMETTLVAAPVISNITAVSTSSMRVDWTQDGNLNTSIIQCNDSNGDSAADSVTVTDGSLSVLLGGLIPGTEYMCTITAYISDNNQDTSQAVIGVTVAAPPGDFNVVVTTSDTELTVTWSVPLGGCGGISILYFEKNTPEDSISSVEHCSVVLAQLSGLSYNGQYIVEIRTINPAGGQHSETLNRTQILKPGKVRNFQTSNHQTKSMRVTWGFPADSVMENKLDRYVLQVLDTEDSDKCVKQVTFSEEGIDLGPANTCDNNIISTYDEGNQSVNLTIGGLLPCSDYRLKVWAENNGGSGEGEEITAGTTAGVPEGKVEINVITSSTNSMSLSWHGPTEPVRCPIINYTITYTYEDCTGVLDITKTQITTDTTAIIPDLQAYWDYTLYIEAETTAGKGDSKSDERTEKTLEREPGVPTLLSVSAINDDYITVFWEPPDLCDRNGVISSYNVYWEYKDRSQHCDDSGTGESHGIIVLTLRFDAKPYKDYMIRVAAVNGAGEGDKAESTNIQRNEDNAGQVDSTSLQFDTSHEYTITLSWDEPCPSHGSITNYTVKFEAEDLPCQLIDPVCSGEVNTADKFLTITDLQPYQMFSFSVMAWTTVGEGAASDNVKIMSGIAVPLAPINVTADEISATELNVTWTPPEHFPGPTNYTVRAEDKTIPVDSKEVVVTGYDKSSAFLTGLDPFWEYDVAVTATTDAGSTSSTKHTIRMPQAGPAAVHGFKVFKEEDKCTLLEFAVEWQTLEGKSRRGVIKNYTVTYWPMDGVQEMSDAFYDTVGEGQTQTGTITQGINHLEYYNFKIVAYSEAAAGDESMLDHSIISGACAPRFPSEEEEGSTDDTNTVTTDSSQDGVDKSRQFRISVANTFYNDESNGKLTSKGLIVMEDGADNGRSEQFSTQSEFEQSYVRSWHEAMTDTSFIESYRVDMPLLAGFSNRAKRNTDGSTEIVVGSYEPCSAISGNSCNGLLVEEKTYRVRLFTCTVAGCTVTSPSKQFSTGGLAVNSSSPIVIVAAVVSAIILFVIAAGVGIFWMRRRQAMTNKPNGESTTTMDVRYGPISISDFPKHVRKFETQGEIMSQEFQDLLFQSQADGTSNAAQRNRNKIRHLKVTAFDHARVKLQYKTRITCSDFINAAYMKGFSSEQEYIATQGPLPSTLADFWTMIWDSRCVTIVMLTNLEENDRVKCEQYWPSNRNETTKYGNINVNWTTIEPSATYMTRKMTIDNGSSQHEVTQYHYTSWQAGGVPGDPAKFAKFAQYVREHTNKAPMVVHCSSGIGRTGIFIAVDQILERFKARCDFIDVFGAVLEMRKNLQNMVPKECQYLFIHKCIVAALTPQDGEESVYEQINDEYLTPIRTYESLLPQPDRGYYNASQHSNQSSQDYERV